MGSYLTHIQISLMVSECPFAGGWFQSHPSSTPMPLALTLFPDHLKYWEMGLWNSGWGMAFWDYDSMVERSEGSRKGELPWPPFLPKKLHVQTTYSLLPLPPTTEVTKDGSLKKRGLKGSPSPRSQGWVSNTEESSWAALLGAGQVGPVPEPSGVCSFLPTLAWGTVQPGLGLGEKAGGHLGLTMSWKKLTFPAFFS